MTQVIPSLTQALKTRILKDQNRTEITQSHSITTIQHVLKSNLQGISVRLALLVVSGERLQLSPILSPILIDYLQ